MKKSKKQLSDLEKRREAFKYFRQITDSNLELRAIERRWEDRVDFVMNGGFEEVVEGMKLIKHNDLAANPSEWKLAVINYNRALTDVLKAFDHYNNRKIKGIRNCTRDFLGEFLQEYDKLERDENYN